MSLSQKRRILLAIKNDINFLSKNGIMDYSLLMTVEDTEKDEERQFHWNTCGFNKNEETYDILKDIGDDEVPLPDETPTEPD